MRTSYKEGELLTKDDIGLVFKDRVGRQWKIVCLNEDQKLVAVVNETSERFLIHDIDKILSLSRHISDDSYDLVSFVGPDFTEDKKLRKFEFEAYVGENTTKENERIDPESAIDKTFGYPCGHKLVINKNSYHPHYQYTSKWKVTMEELPNGSN